MLNSDAVAASTGPLKTIETFYFLKSQTTIICQPLAKKFQERKQQRDQLL